MNKLETSMGVFCINTVCTLRCKRCITLTPYQKKPTNFPKENIFKEIDKFFEIYKRIDHFDIEGGEPLLHPDLSEIIEKGLTYQSCFDRLHVLTNGTLMPDEKTISACRGNNILFIIDDYGDLSRKKDELIEVLIKNNIAYRVDKYNGDDQYCGGWVDFGDFKYKNYSETELWNVFRSCREAYCGAPFIKNGKLFLCNFQGSGIEYIPLREGEYVDLFDDTVPLEKKIEIAAGFGKKPVASCSYCRGFDVENGERYPAAEQLEKNIDEERKICL